MSPTFYRPRAHQAWYRLTARATHDAITQAVREFSGRLAAVRNGCVAEGWGL